MQSSVVSQIKERLNIEDIVSRYVTLRKSGRNNFGLCPFHSEKTPSFSVNSDLGIYKCFGCGETGDVISFYQKIENVDFKEALEALGKIAGIEIRYSPKDVEKEKQLKRIYQINEFSKNFFQYILLKHRLGEKAREYIKKRGITNKSIEDFGIGYAPSLATKKKIFLDFAQKKGITLKELFKAGLLVEREGNWIDKFRERLIFSIHDLKGRVVAFSGRIIEKSDYAPKYLNSPETEIFYKSDILYGLYQAKESIRKSSEVIIVEGQMDVISSYQVGVTNVVAPLGTSLTPSHLKILKRYASKIIFCFDQDEAGEKALKRSIMLALSQDFDVSSVAIKDAKDIDELIQKDPKLWIEAAKKHEVFIDYMIKMLLERLNTDTVDGKVKFVAEISPFINAINNKIKRNFYINEISRLLTIEKEILEENISKAGVSDIQEVEKSFKNSFAQTLSQNQEAFLIFLILNNPKVALLLQNKVKTGYFTNPKYREFIEFFKEVKTEKDFSKGIKKLDTEIHSVLAEIVFIEPFEGLSNVWDDASGEQIKKEILESLLHLREKYYKDKLYKLSKEVIGLSKEERPKVLSRIKSYVTKIANVQKKLSEKKA